jgi:hypothetical protein
MSLAGASTVVAPFLNRDTVLADQGFYFVAISPTPGTGIANTVTTETTLAQAEVAPYLSVYNGNVIPGAGVQPVNIYPTYLRLTMTAANAVSTVMRFTLTLDQGNRITTQPAAAGVLTINNVNMGSTNRSAAQILGNNGTMVASAPTAQRRIIGNQSFRNGGVISVIGDVYQFNFGATEQLDPMSLVETGTAICNVTYNFAPVVIGPNQSFFVQQWATGQTTAPAFEIEFGFIEK